MLIKVGTKLKDNQGHIWEVQDITATSFDVDIHIKYANVTRTIGHSAVKFYEVIKDEV